MTTADAVRFWQSATRVSPGFVGAYLETGRPVAHLHEEWQFAVPEIPSTISLGAFRRFAAGECEVTVVAPYEVHAEGGGGIETAPRWRALFVAPSVVLEVYGAEPRFQGPILADHAAAFALRDLLRRGEQGAVPEAELETAIRRWLEQLLLVHAGGVRRPARAPGLERARVYLQERPTAVVSLHEVGAAAGGTTSHL